ncbi:hypothetical protein [Kordiimonas sp.]|uniref:hypothetical protein n=1 Tax=Kordiimonas sp. TaxID=1970157 RepID=UPI003A9532C8
MDIKFELANNVERSLSKFISFEWYESVLRAANAAEGGNQRAFVELIRTVRSSQDVNGMEDFREAVLSQCHLVQSDREKLECANVCHDLGYAGYCYECLKALSELNYWPAQYRLGYLLLSDESYSKFPDDGHALLKASSGRGHREGTLMSLSIRARDSQAPLRYWHLLRAFLMVPVLAGRAKSFGVPEERSQLDD